jgi:hypothetical protein
MRGGELSRGAFLPPDINPGDGQHGDHKTQHSDENAVGQQIMDIGEMQRPDSAIPSFAG